ncbi:hypothetical protein NUH87_28560 [Pseudomonas batumici]|uniref:hypothetical protein n=1 Tax=Pseudomonas batumici TaxID=226910 RepID=UPI0030CC6114
MSTVIAQLADMVPSDDLLAQIDVAEVYEKFHRTFKLLDKFKQVRDEHERRSFFGRLFNQGELKSAQLDAQEVQAEFSKTLAQLMVISSLQSQQLTQQQELIRHQQDDLRTKAEELARQNLRLEQHQTVIRDQATKLRSYVTDLLNVQGLTDEHGETLIRIAEEVMATRDTLLADFDGRMQEIGGALESQLEQSQRLLEQHTTRAEQQQVELRSEVDSRFEHLQQTLQQQLLTSTEAQQADANRQLALLRSVVTEQEQALQALRAEHEQNAVSREAALKLLRIEQQNSEARLRRSVRMLLAGLCGLSLAGAVSIFGVYQLNRPLTVEVSSMVQAHDTSSN